MGSGYSNSGLQTCATKHFIHYVLSVAPIIYFECNQLIHTNNSLRKCNTQNNIYTASTIYQLWFCWPSLFFPHWRKCFFGPQECQVGRNLKESVILYLQSRAESRELIQECLHRAHFHPVQDSLP